MRRVIGVALAIVVAGCGDDREAGAREAAASYVAAVVDGDGDTACAAMTETARRELEETLGSVGPVRRRLGDDPSCRRLIAFLAVEFRGDDRTTRARRLVKELRDSAGVELDDAGADVTYGRTEIVLVEAGDRWLVQRASL